MLVDDGGDDDYDDDDGGAATATAARTEYFRRVQCIGGQLHDWNIYIFCCVATADAFI